MKAYAAASPSMNDQWSGKTWSSALRTHGAPPTRSSTARASRRIMTTRSSPPDLPERRSGRRDEVGDGDQVVVLDAQRQLGKGAGGRTEHGLGAGGHVEERLVTGADELVGLRLVEADRAAGVGAHLGEGDVA